MTTFLQLHLLTAYPASNLNRDDTGSPKTLKFGGADRLRVSSQSIKRAIRTSDQFATAMGDAMGVRSQSFARHLFDGLKARGLEDAEALKRVHGLIAADGLGKAKKETPETEQLVHLGNDEIQRLNALLDKLKSSAEISSKEALVVLERPKAADIAMFGRMLADNPGYNVEAAVQVAHAFTTHRVTIEDDYYTAVDDLKARDRTEDRGAGFIGIQEYGAGLFYLYVCIDADLLARNLSDDTNLARAATKAFIEAACTVSPKGKQNSYASRSRALYAMVERGPDAPRTLAAAFMKPIAANGEADVTAQSIKALEDLRGQFAHAYGDAGEHKIMNVTAGKGTTLAEIVTFALEAFDGRAA